MYILGFSDSVHDRSVCIFKNATPLVAIEEERLTRVKHGLALYKESRKNPAIFSQMNLEHASSDHNEKTLLPAVQYCLDALDLTMDDIDLVIGNSLHLSFPFHKRALYLNHHVAHAASAFYASGFKDAAILVTDGYGDLVDDQTYETVLLGHGRDKRIDVHSMISGRVTSYYDMQNSIGVFYRIGSLLSGFGMFDEGKTMGLSAFGKPVFYDQIKKYLTYGKESVEINNKLVWDELSVQISNREDFETRANIASSFQKHLEEMVLFYVNILYKRTKSDSLCIAGGVGLNCVSNAKLFASSKFKNIFVFPATGDNGISMGSAYYAAHHILGLPRTPQLSHSYFGKIYTSKQEQEALKKYAQKITFVKKTDAEMTTLAANHLQAQDILMWYQEGSELGPRALGHRSILANPSQISTKDYINEFIKFREMFRPLAPIILEEEMTKYFRFNHSSPFMLFSPPVTPLAIKTSPATVHVDQTSRLQTIRSDQNKKLHTMITKFFKLSKLPIILNTSFNGKDEPIVETPQEAIEAFLNSPVKYLCMDSWYVTKK